MPSESQASVETVETGESARPLPPRRRGRRLGNIENVKSALADVVRKLESGDLEPKRSNALVYALSTLASIMQGDLEERLAAVEATLHGAGR